MTKSWAQLVIGIWVLISPWVLGASGISLIKWSNVIAGTVLTLVGVWSLFGKDPDQTD